MTSGWSPLLIRANWEQREGFLERWDVANGEVEICVCWPDGMSHGIGSTYKSCARMELNGYGEAGV